MGDEEFKHRDRDVARERRFAGARREPTSDDLAAARKAELHAQSLTLHADLRRLIAEARSAYAKHVVENAEAVSEGRLAAVPMLALLAALDKAVDVIDFQRERIQELRAAMKGRPKR